MNMEILIQTIFLVVGFFMLIKGADWFVEGASKIADHFRIPQLVIGLTIVAFGTSAPEAAISIAAALKGTADITIGNVVGSNILNILLILGITSIIIPLAVQKSTKRVEIPFMIIISVLLLFLGGIDGTLSILDGIVLWIFFLIFLGYLLYMAKRGQDVVGEVPKDDKNTNMLFLVIMTILGLGLIVIGSDITVDSATVLAQYFGISERLIGLTVVAFGTSLPELITSVTAAQKGKNDIAIGNIVGSNIFNILFVIGTTAFITDVPFADKFLIDGVICIFSSVLLFLLILKENKLKKWGGIGMLAAYSAYFVYLVL